LDIILADDIIISEKKLIIPHPGLHERYSVLAPLAEIAPDLVHPIIKQTIKELLNGLQ